MTGSSIHDKIRKLLALSEGQANEAESNSAMEMATRLMMEHGISEEALRGTAQQYSVGSGERVPVLSEAHHTLARAASLMMGTRLLQAKDASWVSFVGRPENRRQAESLFIYLVLQMDALYREALPRGLTQSKRAKLRKEYKKGVAMRVLYTSQNIVGRMIDQRSPSSGSTALTILSHRETLMKEIDEFLELGKFGSAKPKRGSHKPLSDEFYQGYQAGSAVKLNGEMG